MATNLMLDDKLIEEALILGKHKSKRETVNAALKEYILNKKQRELIPLFNTFDFDSDYHYKKGRHRK